MSETKLYTRYEVDLYPKVFSSLRDEGYFNEISKNLTKNLPFPVNQDTFGAYNIGFFMWRIGREEAYGMLEEMLEGTESVEQIRKRLKAQRRMELGEWDGKA